MDDTKQPPSSLLNDELRASIRASVAQGFQGLEEYFLDRIANMSMQPPPTAPSSGLPSQMSPETLSSLAGLAAPQYPSDAQATQEAKCFMLAETALPAGVSSRPCGICMLCSAGLTPSQRAIATRKGTETGVARSDCYICQMKALKPEAFTTPFCDFLTTNPTIFHAVGYFKEKLSAAGFKELSTRDNWNDKIEPGGKYYVTRNGSSLMAFKVGPAYEPGNGVAIVAGHIDALTAKLKPVSKKPEKAGYVQLGVAPYAGALNETWWDRDLSIGGRVIVRDSATGKTVTKLVKLGWPIAKIPTLAPHFGVGMLGSQNKETQVVPVIGLSTGAEEAVGEVGTFVASQPPKLVKLIASELGISSDSYSSIVNWELELYDHAPAVLAGMDKELISAGRIDDKLCSWAALAGLILSEDAPTDGGIKLVALFDDEEIGSLLRQGAKGNFLPSVIERTVEALTSYEGDKFGPSVIGQTYARSFLVSADVTHAANPNFLERYQGEHLPLLNVGLVVCQDSNGHMTTDSVSTAICNRVAELSGCTNQQFMIRNDSRSGGTVGPTISSMLGVRAADAGLPQLSMHSIRATTGALDPGLGVKWFKGFLDNWEKIDAEWEN